MHWLRTFLSCFNFVFGLLQKVVVKLDIFDEKEKKKALKIVSSLSGTKNYKYFTLYSVTG